MKKVSVVFVLVIVLAAFLTTAALAAPGATKVTLVDACNEIGPAFCDANGASEAAGARGFATFNPTPKNKDILRVVVKKSLPLTEHQVYACTTDGSFGVGESGYTNCTSLGVFKTNGKGNGNFKLNYTGAFDPNWKVITVNTMATGTILANEAPIQ